MNFATKGPGRWRGELDFEGWAGVRQGKDIWGRRNKGLKGVCSRIHVTGDEGMPEAAAEAEVEGSDLRARYTLPGSLGLILQASCEKFEGILEAEWVTLETVRRFHMGHPVGSFWLSAQIAVGRIHLINRRPRAVAQHKPPVPYSYSPSRALERRPSHGWRQTIAFRFKAFLPLWGCHWW